MEPSSGADFDSAEHAQSAVRSGVSAPATSPARYEHIGLAATPSLRRGAASSFARLLRELTPYLEQHWPHLYLPEGSYRTLLTAGLLRGYPPNHLHCVASGRLGGLADLGAGVVGEQVAGLAKALGDPAHMKRVVDLLDLGWTLDCVVYLLDPRDPTSSLPGTLALKRECLVTAKPFLGTYASAIEWFNLLDCASPTSPHVIDHELADRLGYSGAFPHRTIALVAHDASKAAMVDYVAEHVPFLQRFEHRIATNTTGQLLNCGHDANDPERTEGAAATAVVALAKGDEELVKSISVLRKRLSDNEVDPPWVQALKSGPRGGDLQIGEAVAMGLCDATLFFEDPQQAHEHDADIQLFERSARIANHADQLGKPAQLMCLHDPLSAAIWVELWERALSTRGSMVTLVAAYRELFNVDLVVAPPAQDRRNQWHATATEAASYLISALADTRQRASGARLGDPARVTLGAGRSVREVIEKIGDVTTALSDRITAHHTLREERIKECMSLFPNRRHQRILDLIASRKAMTLRSSALATAMWQIGPVVVAPMVGSHASPDPEREARGNAKLLQQTVRGDRVRFGESAFVHHELEPRELPPEIDYHWHNTDIAVMSCGDLTDYWFGGFGKVPLPLGMYSELLARGACGDLSGLYLDRVGNEIEPKVYRRLGMSLTDLKAVARAGDGRASILVAGGDPPPDDKPTSKKPGPPTARSDAAPERALPRARMVLAAIRSGAVSTVVTDAAYARAVLALHAGDLVLQPLIGLE